MSFSWKVFFCYFFISSPSYFFIDFYGISVGWLLDHHDSIFSHIFWFFSIAFWKISLNLFCRPFDELVHNHIFNFQETILFSDLCSIIVAYFCFTDARTYQISIALLTRIFQNSFLFPELWLPLFILILLFYVIDFPKMPVSVGCPFIFMKKCG